jgi:hypothetical protein
MVNDEEIAMIQTKLKNSRVKVFGFKATLELFNKTLNSFALRN